MRLDLAALGRGPKKLREGQMSCRKLVLSLAAIVALFATVPALAAEVTPD